MASGTTEPGVVRVSKRAKRHSERDFERSSGLRHRGEVFVYEEQGRIIIEPVPSPDEPHGIHEGDHERGEVIERVHEITNEEKQQEAERVDRLRPSDDPWAVTICLTLRLSSHFCTHLAIERLPQYIVDHRQESRSTYRACVLHTSTNTFQYSRCLTTQSTPTFD